MTVSKSSRPLPSLGTTKGESTSQDSAQKGWVSRIAVVVGRWLGQLMVLAVVVVAAVSTSLAWSLNERLQESEAARKVAEKGNSGVEDSLLKTRTELGKLQVQLYETEEEVRDLNTAVKARDAEIDVLRNMLGKQIESGSSGSKDDTKRASRLDSIFGK